MSRPAPRLRTKVAHTLRLALLGSLLAVSLVSRAEPADGQQRPPMPPMQEMDRAGPPPDFHGGPGGPGFGGLGPEGFGPGFGEMDGPPPFLHGLQLSEEQRDRIFDILHQQAPQARKQAKAVRAAHEALREADLVVNYNEAKVRSLTEALAKAEAAQQQSRLATAHRLYSVLDADQRRLLESRKEGRRGPDGDERRGPGADDRRSPRGPALVTPPPQDGQAR